MVRCWRVVLGCAALLAALGADGLSPASAGASVLLPTGRVLTPAGTMTSAGDFPAAALLSGGALWAADAGTGANGLIRYDPTTGAAVPLPLIARDTSANEAPYALSGGLAVSPDGTTLYAAGGATGVLHAVSLPGGVPLRDIPTGSGFAGGVAVSADGRRLFVTEPFDARDRFGKGTRLLAVPASGAGAPVAVTVGSQPLAVIDGVVRGREIVGVANRDDGTITVLDAAHLTPIATVPTGRQPSALALTPDGGQLLVTDSLDDRLVTIDTQRWTVRSALRLGRGERLGAAPNALAVAPDGGTAYVSLATDNAIAVVSRSRRGGRWREAGEIPTGWYPTAVVADPAGASLLVSTGKGVGAVEATPPGLPGLAVSPFNPGPSGFGGSGTIERIPLPDAAALAAYTRRVAANDDPCGCAGRHPLPPGMRAIKHVVYVIRENKTFDEELGDEPGGAPAGLLYGRDVTPDTHALAERFALLQSFYADEEVSDTGHQALMGGVANDWVERFSQQAYGLDGAPRQGAELGNDASTLWSPGSYLLDDALAHGVSFTDYGEFYRRDQRTDAAVSSALESHIDHAFPHFGFDPSYPDTGRIAYWKKVNAHALSTGRLPALQVIYLPEDHTSEGLPPAPLPQQQVADADLATGQLIEALSHSPAWGSTAVFLTEDDPQSGVDHVDQHRTVGLVVSPHVHAGAVAAHYDQAGMLRTIEEILGLPPMSELDALARPMSALFSPTADDRPFAAIVPHPPQLPAAAAARVRAEALRVLGRHPALDQVSPEVQRNLQRLAHP